MNTPAGFSEAREARARARAQVVQLEKSYLAVFGDSDRRTDEQKAVMADMARRFAVFAPLAVTGSVDVNDMLLREGKRQVVLFINDVVDNHALTRNLTEEERNQNE